MGENGYIESFNGKLRDELLDGEVFYTIDRGEGVNGSIQADLQSGQAAQLPRLSATSTGNHPASRIISGAAASNCDYVPGPFQAESDQRSNWLKCLGYDLSTRSWYGPHSVIGYGGVTL